jgi:hypothetical protein
MSRVINESPSSDRISRRSARKPMIDCRASPMRRKTPAVAIHPPHVLARPF